MAIAVAIGVPAGIVSAVGRGRWWDYAANVFALWGLSTPNFWLGILMILLFSVELGWLPASGYVSPFEDLRANLAAMIMPAFVLGNAIAAVLMRHTRSAMLQVLSADYVRTARAKGLAPSTVVLKHALRNALTPIITLGALEFGTLLSGAVLTEQVFTIPGFGKLIVDSVFNRDFSVVQGVVLVTATAYIAAESARRPRGVRGQPEAARMTGGLSTSASTSDGSNTAAPGGVASTDVVATDDRRDADALAVVDGAAAAAGPWRAAWRRLRRRRGAMVGLVVVMLFAIVAIFAPWIAPFDPIATSWSAIRKAPDAQHWFGTDDIGRDVLSRVVWGTRASLARRRRVGIDLAAVRRADRPRRRIRRRPRRRGDLADRRRVPRVPVPDPRDRARGVPRPEPRRTR